MKKPVKFRPLGPRVLVRFEDPETTSKGGIVIPDNALRRPQEAVVVAVGSGRELPNGTRVPPSVKVGDRVLVHQHAHTVAPIVLEGVLYHVVDAWNADCGEVFGVLT